MEWKELWRMISEACVTLAGKLVLALAVLLVGRLIISLIKKRFLNSKKAEKLDPTFRSYMQTAARITVKILVLVAIVGILGVPIASIIAVISAAGAAIALALQGSLSNLAGGLMLILFRPFRVGNYIEADGHQGTVTEIGIFYTTLRTFDNKQVFLPNGKLISASLVNYSAEKTRRVDVSCSVAYGSDVETVQKAILDYAASHPLILQTPPPAVRMTEMGESSIDFTVRVWAETKNYWDVKFDLTENIYALFRARGIEIPFPQMDVHIKQ